MAPILRYCLPAMGYCRNFPRDVMFAPLMHMGLGIEHLYTVQEILRLKDIIFHNSYSTDTGSFYRISLELLLVEAGISSNLSDLPFSTLSCLATNSLIKSTGSFSPIMTYILNMTSQFLLPGNMINPL
jgi:hypothetical protein